MEYKEQVDGSKNTLVMSGKFTFADHEAFRAIIALIKSKQHQMIAFDVEGIEFVDSAALGMLLIAREEAETANVDIIIKNPTGQIEKMFRVSKFDSLFKIQK
jgi:anti-anti-sigma factor